MRAFIFDLDGVICHTDQFHYQAWKKMADQENIYFDQQINNRLRGVSRMASLDIILEQAQHSYTPEEKIALAQRKNEYYKALLQQMGPKDLSSDILPTLNQLRHLGYKLAIGSSSRNTKLILRQIGLADFFDAVADGNDIAHSKPNPEVFLLAAQKLNIFPSDAYVVEDAFAGIEAAKAGNFIAIAIGDAKADQRADLIINSFADLLPIATNNKE